ncbi:MAG: hypothetical protein JXB35_18670 [Anaerolineae bacterium]|nr:hypothetical protein [Anaerolineae bacterium]
MITVEKLDTRNRRQLRQFLQLPYRLYRRHPQWVPPPLSDVKTMLNREQHPFYEHSEADFFMVLRDGEAVGRIAVMENRPFNTYHNTRKAQFYLFECENDPMAAQQLLVRAFEWARRRDLDTMVGPKGFGPVDGYGILVSGFEHRQMMTMLKYNYDYYPQLLEAQGFEKEVDFVSSRIDPQTYELPERVQRIARRLEERGSLKVKRFASKRDLKSWSRRIGEAYNGAFVNNWEYYPLTQRELDFVVGNILTIADPRLIKIIMHEDDIVGFLFGFPDISAALQRAGGRLTPWALVDILREVGRAKTVALNGAGILPEFHGIGGNALLYAEMDRTIRDYNFENAAMIQIAETAVQMRSDLQNLGAQEYQNHRVYQRAL